MKHVFSLLVAMFASASFAQSVPSGTPAMWRQPAPVQQLDMFWGSGGEAQRPVGPFKFIEEDTHGTNPKLKVVDSRGVKWGVKFDDEVHSEVAATRFFWAAGYRTDHAYFVPAGVITGASNLQRTAGFVDSRGRFKDARFETDHKEAGVTATKNFKKWKWNSHPFVGTKEFSGLLLMNVLTSNFDTKTDNNKVQSVTYSNGQVYNWYMIGDLGGTFGKAGGGGHSKWDLGDYRVEPFIGGVSGGRLRLLHRGKDSEYFQSIPVEHARWLYKLLAGLSRSQIEDAFRAAYSDRKVNQLSSSSDERTVRGFADVVEQRLRTLGNAVR
ncbi:MAG TPA: hypothetical protein VFV50_04020 [Bdellovibrionales bacterium]|nr:hypothetical protein [Bdellovibrionales bacterium]